MTQNCLIGYTGFVSGQLASQSEFSAVFNIANIVEIVPQEFYTLVCAAAPGSMFEANKFPDQDQAKIQALINKLSKVRTSRFILISSVAVLEDFASGDDEGTTGFQKELVYCSHRRALEAFEDRLVVRLPALFGQGLRNISFLNNWKPPKNCISRTFSQSKKWLRRISDASKINRKSKESSIENTPK